MQQLKVCAFCQITGKKGANFVLRVGSDESRVHKFCGEKLQAQAPAGVTVSLVHWSDLPRVKEEERVSNFWAGKFAKAEARKNGEQKAA